MNGADWVIAVVIAISALISLKRGFVREALSLAVWILALVVAFAFHARLATMLGTWVDPPSLRFVLAFASLFLVTLVLGALLARALGELVRVTGLTGTDRVLGMVFGCGRGVLVCLAVLALLPMALPVHQDEWWQQSLLIPHFMVLEEWAREVFPGALAALRDMVN